MWGSNSAHLEEAAGFEFPPDCESYDKIVS